MAVLASVFCFSASAQISFGQILPPPPAADFTGVIFGSIASAFSDIDGDGDPDVLIMGSNSVAELYTNDGSGGYSLVSGTPFTGVTYESIAF